MSIKSREKQLGKSKNSNLWHDGHTLGVDGTQIGVLEQTHKVGLGSLLKGEEGRGLEAEITLSKRNKKCQKGMGKKKS